MPAFEYHVHVDAHAPISQDFDLLLRQSGFVDADFEHREDADGYEPLRHLTCKPANATLQRNLFVRLQEYVAAHQDALVGYIEAEAVTQESRHDQPEFNPAVPVPVSLNFGRLSPGQFRQDEIHITMDHERSDPRLMANLRAMGMHMAYLKRDGRVRAVFTVQGPTQTIRELWPVLDTYLSQTGGLSDGWMSEEIVTHWWASSPDIPLPPVISKIEWR